MARPSSPARAEARLAWALVLPALGMIALIALFPLLWTAWESLHLHDLRMPWRGRPFVGLANYTEALSGGRFWQALGHTAIFTVGSVTLELSLGLLLALALNRAYRGRGLVRTAVLLPWALPAVVAALLWGFLFDSQAGIVNAVLADVGFLQEPFVWFGHTTAAWVPVILADVWKMTPFVTLLLLAGLQNIDGSLYEAARMDGAGPWQQFVHVTLPLLKPALLVAVIFRTLDAVRVFDLIYVLTQGGPGTATEPIALYTFTALLQHLRFGFGSALSVIIFLVAFLLALVYIRLLGANLTESRP
jgi:ABC-type sugar transport system permease subunit